MLRRKLPITARIASNLIGSCQSKLEKQKFSTMNTQKEEMEIITRLTKNEPLQMKSNGDQKPLRKRTNIQIPGIVSLQILGTGANGSPCGVYMFTDQSRYLFNCGEGTQRLAHEHKTKLSRLEQVFLTRNTWHMVGGFPGLALTIQDIGVKEISIHGPPFLENILHSMKRFVVLKSLKVNTIDCTEKAEFQDNVMTVTSFPLYNSDNKIQNAVCYICNLKPRPGALNLEKCVEHGITPGPLLGLLKSGIDVTLDNGNVVKSKDVSEPDELPFSFMILDVPNEKYMMSFEQQMEEFISCVKKNNSKVSVVLHFGCPAIVENSHYKNIVEKIANSAEHIYLNSSKSNFSGFVASHRIQYQLNQLNSRVFPLLGEALETVNINGNNLSLRLKKTKLGEDIKQEKEKINDQLVRSIVNSMTNYHLRPKKMFDFTSDAKLSPKDYIEETRVLPDFPNLLKELRTIYPDIDLTSRLAHYPKLNFLGTGSCIPNKTRNVSGILLEVSENSFFMLDCGEGTLGQIIRFYGATKAEEIIKNLHAIYISHLHADHHIGLIGILNEKRRLGCSKRVLLFAPVQLETWLEFYDENIEPISKEYVLIRNSEMLSEPMELEETHPEMNISEISTCLVKHCPHSYAIALTLKEKFEGKPIKITYSGDTMPCQDLIILGKNSTILIHEATMEDDLIEEARVKMHSTISEAINQGQLMAAQHIILTHFSQRYAKLPRMQISNDSLKGENTAENVSIAFDNMQITLADLPHFHLMYPALKALFAEHANELEEKAKKRERKLERKRKLLITE